VKTFFFKRKLFSRGLSTCSVQDITNNWDSVSVSSADNNKVSGNWA